MNWDDLRVVLAVHRNRTLTQAARVLGVNHSTVSRRLGSLQDELGVRLFDRLPDGYVATTAGEDVVAAALRMEEQVLDLDRQVLGRDESLSGPLRVTTTDMAAFRHADIFASFVERYPNVALEVSADNSPRSLTRREADVALRITNSPPEHLVGRKVARSEWALYGAISLVESLGEPDDLEAYPWLGWDQRPPITEAWLRRHVPRARIACRVDSTLVMLRSLELGIGIAHTQCIDGDSSPHLRRLRPVMDNWGMDLWLLTHPDLRHTARVRAFLDHAEARLRPLADQFAGREKPVSSESS
jgi:DNA-binding transcriptional LysR family regulator